MYCYLLKTCLWPGPSAVSAARSAGEWDASKSASPQANHPSPRAPAANGGGSGGGTNGGGWPGARPGLGGPRAGALEESYRWDGRRAGAPGDEKTAPEAAPVRQSVFQRLERGNPGTAPARAAPRGYSGPSESPASRLDWAAAGRLDERPPMGYAAEGVDPTRPQSGLPTAATPPGFPRLLRSAAMDRNGSNASMGGGGAGGCKGCSGSDLH